MISVVVETIRTREGHLPSETPSLGQQGELPRKFGKSAEAQHIHFMRLSGECFPWRGPHHARSCSTTRSYIGETFCTLRKATRSRVTLNTAFPDATTCQKSHLPENIIKQPTVTQERMVRWQLIDEPIIPLFQCDAKLRLHFWCVGISWANSIHQHVPRNVQRVVNTISKCWNTKKNAWYVVAEWCIGSLNILQA